MFQFVADVWTVSGNVLPVFTFIKSMICRAGSIQVGFKHNQRSLFKTAQTPFFCSAECAGDAVMLTPHTRASSWPTTFMARSRKVRPSSSLFTLRRHWRWRRTSSRLLISTSFLWFSSQLCSLQFLLLRALLASVFLPSLGSKYRQLMITNAVCSALNWCL